MKTIMFFTVLFCLLSLSLHAQEKDDSSGNLRQFYSAKVGFYQPGDGLNNGLLFGIDGITEFTRHDFFLSGALDLYYKQSFNFFAKPEPDILSQSIILAPLHANFGYRIFDVPSADTRGYIGVGAGYYFYFYQCEYTSTTVVATTRHDESKNGGAFFGTIFGRVLAGKIFVEPRVYLAASSDDNIAGYQYSVKPTGFAITIGFQQ